MNKNGRACKQHDLTGPMRISTCGGPVNVDHWLRLGRLMEGTGGGTKWENGRECDDGDGDVGSVIVMSDGDVVSDGDVGSVMVMRGQ